MLKVVTAKEMQWIDRCTIERYGIAGTILMERAGLAVVRHINELLSDKMAQPASGHRTCPEVIVLSGGGNNGGDGLVVARLLHNQGQKVRVFLTARPEDLKGDARINYNAAVKFGVPIQPVKEFLKLKPSFITHHCIIVDALFGTGLVRDVRSPIAEVIERVNETGPTVVAIDIPSGISSDTGQIMGCAIKAHHTVTFGLPKRGHLLHPGAEYAGRVYVEDIGFPQGLLKSRKIRVNLVERNDGLSLLPERPEYSHKGTYGHVLLIAGSKGKTGAALMAARACLRTGAGLVTIGIPDSLVKAFQSRVTEEMILPLPDRGDGTLSRKALDVILEFTTKRANTLAVGPGLSTDREISELVSLMVTSSKVPVVVDADGINSLAGRPGLLKKSHAPVILTPHPGEMARLLRKSTDDIEKDRIGVAISFARRTKTHLLLKGVPTVIAPPDGEAFINSTGNPGMATAGTGDVLTGMISAFLAQGLSPLNASILGVYMHGLIGDIVAEKKGKHSLIASDIINTIPSAFRTLREQSS